MKLVLVLSLLVTITSSAATENESVDEEIIERLSSLVDEIKATNTEIKDVANEA